MPWNKTDKKLKQEIRNDSLFFSNSSKVVVSTDKKWLLQWTV